MIARTGFLPTALSAFLLAVLALAPAGGVLRADTGPNAAAGNVALNPAAVAPPDVDLSPDAQRLALDYAVYIGGFRTIDMAFDARLGDGAYRMKMDLKAQGMLNWLLDWSMSAYSEGRRQDEGGIVPVKAGHDSLWDGKKRWIRLTFPEGGAPDAKTMPPSERDDRPEVPLEDRLGARDLAGGILSMLLTMGASERCTHSEPVFDGRRRYNLVFRELGTDRLDRSDYSPFAGEATRCSLRIERIAGFKRERSRYRWMSDGSATVWIARPFADAPPVPVKLTIDTAFGPLIAHLRGAVRHDEGEVQSLTAAE